MRHFILVCALIVANCAPSPSLDGPVETRKIGRDFIGGTATSSGSPIRSVFAGKLERRADQVHACVAIGHSGGVRAISAAEDLRIALRFYVGDEKLSARLRFAPIYETMVLSGRLAHCAPLGIAWEDRYETEPITLTFRRFNL